MPTNPKASEPTIPVSIWEIGITHRDRVLLAGLLHGNPDLRDKSLTDADWRAALTEYENSPTEPADDKPTEAPADEPAVEPTVPNTGPPITPVASTPLESGTGN